MTIEHDLEAAVDAGYLITVARYGRAYAVTTRFVASEEHHRAEVYQMLSFREAIQTALSAALAPPDPRRHPWAWGLGGAYLVGADGVVIGHTRADDHLWVAKLGGSVPKGVSPRGVAE